MMDIYKLLKCALKPVGSTMYVWGGGWNDSDTAAGAEAVTIGADKRWRRFFEKCGPDYDFKKEAAPRSCGLDCSGYVGWSIYNALNSESGNEGYVFSSGTVGYRLEALGLGECSDHVTYRPGDILFKNGHVWFCMDHFTDGSVLILHSSPPGVMVNGAPKGSMAHKRADQYMQGFPQWYEKYPVTFRGEDYLHGYKRFRFR